MEEKFHKTVNKKIWHIHGVRKRLILSPFGDILIIRKIYKRVRRHNTTIILFDSEFGLQSNKYIQECFAPMFLKMVTKAKFLKKKERIYGFTEIQTPDFGHIELYKTSSNLDHYSDNMFSFVKADNKELMLRQMTCPHHTIVYSHTRRSYKDLSIRISEHAKFNIEIHCISLSLKEKYYNDDVMWGQTEEQLRQTLNKLGVEYTKVEGEATFYGLKVDMQIKTALGHKITMSTLQLDFPSPEKFDLTYIDANKQKVCPVIIHRGLIDTCERFMAVKGKLKFPIYNFWRKENTKIFNEK